MELFSGPFPSFDGNLFEGRECVFFHHLNAKTYQRAPQILATQMTRERKQKLKENGDKDIKGGETVKKEYLISNSHMYYT